MNSDPLVRCSSTGEEKGTWRPLHSNRTNVFITLPSLLKCLYMTALLYWSLTTTLGRLLEIGNSQRPNNLSIKHPAWLEMVQSLHLLLCILPLTTLSRVSAAFQLPPCACTRTDPTCPRSSCPQLQSQWSSNRGHQRE